MVERRFQRHRVGDGQVVHVEDAIAVICGDAFTQYGLAAECDDLPRHIGACHRDHLDRQREAAQHIDQFAVVHDADELA